MNFSALSIKEQFPAFSFTETNPFAWKDGFLFASQNSLQIIPKSKWYGNVIKNFTSFTSNTYLSQSSLLRIRTEFERLRRENLAVTDLQKIFTANKNISCLNEKIRRYNKDHPHTATPLAIVEKLPLPQLQAVISDDSTRASEARLEELSMPEEGHEPNIEKANLWVQSQHASLQPLAFALAKSVIRNYVDFPTFVASLDKSVAQALKTIGRKPFGIVTWDEPHGSSGPWVRSLLKMSKQPQAEMSILYNKKKLPIPTTTFDVQNKKSRAHTKKNPIVKDWILVDDAVYTGTQLNQILSTLKGKLASLYPNEEIRIHVAIPYMSSFALKNLQTAETNKTNDTITIVPYPVHIMESVAEVAERSLSEEDRQAGQLLVDTLFRNLSCTTYFAHKVGDGVSLPRNLSDGAVWMRLYKLLKQTAVLDEAQSNASFVNYTQFIPEFRPHYRAN